MQKKKNAEGFSAGISHIGIVCVFYAANIMSIGFPYGNPQGPGGSKSD